jgi:ribose transport system permease protein
MTRTLGQLGLRAVERGGLAILLVALIIGFGAANMSDGVFTSSANIRNILGDQSVTGIIALAMVIPLVCGYFDLSVAAVAGLANVTTASVIGIHGAPIWVGIGAALLVGTLAGVVNGFLVAALKLNPFVVTLGTYTLAGGLVQWYTQGQSILTGIPASFSNWGSERWVGVPRPFWLLMAIAVIAWYVLMHTPFGRRLEAVGSNQSAARLVGLRVDRAVFLTFVASGFMAAVAGTLLTSRTGGADPSAAPAYLFPALAAVFLGATAIQVGRYNIWGTIVGVFFVAVGVNALTIAGADTWVAPVFDGGSLVLAVAVSTGLARRREKRTTSDEPTRVVPESARIPQTSAPPPPPPPALALHEPETTH